MPLSSGTTLGPYQIDAPLGAGGMGEVYKATDTRLDRTVAIKVLPEHVASDPDLKQRFEREARTVAALNHPHICTLHDIGSQGGIDFLVMEYLDGQTLAERLEKGALPLDQALQIAIDIADALDKAHRQGIVHRDLKPGNIMLTKAGAKLLDFGLAKLKPPEQAGGLSALPTQPGDLTQQGAILGTFQYMAPEQLEGGEADQRTDIFAFGAVVYEMVTGRKAFEGKSQASLIAAILEREPPAMSDLQAMSPPVLDPIIKTCLTKDPDDRWQSVGDVGRQLGSVARRAPSSMEVVPGVPAHPRNSALYWVGAALVVGALVGVLVTGTLRPSLTSSPDVLRFTMRTPEITGPEVAIRGMGDIVISPDGSKVLYRGVGEDGQGTQLYLRALDELQAKALQDTEGAFGGVFSPDGESVAFARQTATLERVSIFGGAAQTIAQLPDTMRGIRWATDDVIVVGGASGLLSVTAETGEVRPLTVLRSDDGELIHSHPSTMPNEEDLLFVIERGEDVANFELAGLSATTGEITSLGIAGTSPRYVETGHLVYVADDGSLRAVPFDHERFVVMGAPTTLIDQIMVTEWQATNFDVSRAGRMIYMPGTASSLGWQVVWVSRQGEVVDRVVEGVTAPWPRLSPDGTKVAVTIAPDIWIHDLASGVDTRLTEGGGAFPMWSPDGTEMFFSSNRSGVMNLYSRRIGLSQEAVAVLESERTVLPGSLSGDGGTLVYYSVHPDTQRDLWMQRNGGNPTPFLVTEFNESNPRVSPDGQWLAYASDQSGESRIYVTPFPEGGRAIPVSTGPGAQAVWSRDGKELFYRHGNQMLVVEVDTSRDFTMSEPTLVFDEPFVLDPPNSGVQTYDVSLDGQRFLMVKHSEDAVGQLTIVLNWFEELKARVPGP